MGFDRLRAMGCVLLASAVLMACGDDEGGRTTQVTSSSGGSGGSGGGMSDACGDGVLDAAEGCDDGDTVEGDGCNSACQVEDGYDCMGEPSVCASSCGDGLVASDEGCDDGNLDAGDGCDDMCVVESGYDCMGEPSSCAAVCGDGVTAGMEGCDDGNTDAGDGCDGMCQIESGYDCMGEPSMCASTCGDGLVASDEGCDDGNIDAGDGCDGGCVVETGFDCMGEPSSCAPICGDGMIVGMEGCDDGNMADMDGCDSSCMVEAGYTCQGTPSNCTMNCGNGVVDMGEQCDDGNINNGDRCDATCMLEYTVLEVEPNEAIANAQAVADGDIVVGAVSPMGDYDLYELTLAAESFVLLETYTTIDANNTNYDGDGTLGPVVDCGEDTVVRVFDATADVTNLGSALLVDDDDGDGACSYIGPNFEGTLPAGTYYIRVNHFNTSTTIDPYALDVRVEAPLGPGAGCTPSLDLCDPGQLLACDAMTNTCTSSCGNGILDASEECDDGNMIDGDRCSNTCVLLASVIDTEVNDTFAAAQPVVDGSIVKGSLDPANGDSWDLYSFNVTVDSWVILDQYTTVDSDPNNNSSPGAATIPELDCGFLFGGTDPDLHLFDATGDPTMDATALIYDDFAGDNNCAFIGPQTDGSAALLSPGTYYIKVDGFTSTSVVPQYAVDVQLLTALGLGAACNPAFDLCNANLSLACDGTSMTCVTPPPPPIDVANWEQFGAGQLDLANTTLTFTPNGGTYGVLATLAVNYPDTPGMGTIATAPLALPDDNFSQQMFTMSFPFFGTSYNDVYVNSNGNLTFGTGDSDWSETAAEHFDTPRISGLWDDLDPTEATSGPIVYDEYADRVVVTWDGVTKNASTDSIQMQIALYDDGVITITYLAATTMEGLVGISAGSNLGNPPPMLDFSMQVPTAPAAGDLIINELMANPIPGSDTNCDGLVDGVQDEFVEIVNVAGVPLQLNGVTISDSAAVRHTFGSAIVPAGLSIVVYGGGTPTCPGVLAETASTGMLDFGDVGDTVTLSSGGAGAGITYIVAPAGASLTLDPDVIGSFFVDHTTAAGSGLAAFSPGFRVSGAPF